MRDKIQNIFYDIILVAGIGLLLWGGGSALHKYLGEEEDKEMYQELNESFVDESTESEERFQIQWGGGNGDLASAGTIWYKRISVDFDGLNAINQDVVGWIYFENEDISYPILYSGDDSYYLHRTLKKDDSTTGSIFVEGENNPDMEDDVTIIYGHNMKNSSMFGKLRRYKESEDYYKDHQFFQIFTEDGKAYRYRVFSYFDINQHEVDMVDIGFYNPEDPATAETEYRQVDNSEKIQKIYEHFRKRIPAKDVLKYQKEIEELRTETETVIVNEENTYLNYLQTIASRSIRGTGVTVSENDKVVGLFTCSSNKGNRLIVYGVRVAEHDFNKIVEEENTDIRTLDR